MGKFKIVTIALMLVSIAGVLYGCDAGRANAEWEECSMEYGIFNESVPLTVEQENSLGQLIFNSNLSGRELKEVDPTDVLCGGHYFQVKFKKGNMAYLWRFSVNGISQTIFENDEQIEVKHYAGDTELLENLNSYRDQEDRQ